MRYVLQLLIIIFFAFLGEIMHRIIPLPFPASIYGIVLLYTSLELKILKVKHIREVSTTLIIAMPVMFIPPAVGLMMTWEHIKESWVEYIAITILSTFVVMAFAGWSTQIISKKKDKKS